VLKTWASVILGGLAPTFDGTEVHAWMATSPCFAVGGPNQSKWNQRLRRRNVFFRDKTVRRLFKLRPNEDGMGSVRRLFPSGQESAGLWCI